MRLYRHATPPVGVALDLERECLLGLTWPDTGRGRRAHSPDGLTTTLSMTWLEYELSMGYHVWGDCDGPGLWAVLFPKSEVCLSTVKPKLCLGHNRCPCSTQYEGANCQPLDAYYSLNGWGRLRGHLAHPIVPLGPSSRCA